MKTDRAAQDTECVRKGAQRREPTSVDRKEPVFTYALRAGMENIATDPIPLLLVRPARRRYWFDTHTRPANVVKSENGDECN